MTSTIDGDSANIDEINNRVSVETGDDIQTKITNAGVGGILEFSPGAYATSGLTPENNQTWLAGQGVELQPTEDSPVLDLTGTTDVAISPITLSDPNDITTSTELCLFGDGARRNYFERITIDRAYNGVRLATSAGGEVAENVINSIYGREIRNRGMEWGGQVHDNHITTAWLKGLTGSSDGVNISTSGIDGGNIITKILSISFGGNSMSVLNQNREMWVGQAIFDKAGSSGLNYQATGNRAAFFGSLWGSGCANAGARISGTGTSDANKVWDVQIANFYAIGNGDKGANIEYTDGVQIGKAITRDNTSGGIAFQSGPSDNAFIGRLDTGASNDAPANGGPGLIATQAGENVVIGSANVPEGITDVANLKSINGDPMPEDLTARTGIYEGERGYHDGTDGGATNRAEPAVWTGSDWEGEISNSIIT